MRARWLSDSGEVNRVGLVYSLAADTDINQHAIVGRHGRQYLKKKQPAPGTGRGPVHSERFHLSNTDGSIGQQERGQQTETDDKHHQRVKRQAQETGNNRDPGQVSRVQFMVRSQ